MVRRSRGGKAKGKLPPQYEFAADLWKAVRATNPHCEIVSPLGFGIVMTLVKVGARGHASDEIASVLRFKDDAAIAHKYFRIFKALEGWKLDGIFLAIFSTVIGPSGATFHNDFVEFAEDDFRAEVRTANYAKAALACKEINKRISEVTKNLIQGTLKPADLSSRPNLMLINTVCFKGLYKNNYRFKSQQTKKETFHNLNGTVSQVDMMTGTADYFYGKFDGYCALSLPYEGGTYALTLVLPDEHTGLKHLENLMDEHFFVNVRSKIKYTNRVFVAKIPKFKVNCRVELDAVLKSMGIRTMFEAKADFGGYFKGDYNGYYSKVLQQCALEVSEKGSEGGAPTKGIKLQTGAVKFEANRPFFFFLTDDKIDTVILMGSKIHF